ncbi:unnamed protein product [Discula destructiva]
MSPAKELTQLPPETTTLNVSKRSWSLGDIRRMYGATPFYRPMSEKQDGEDDDFNAYPTGWARVALLACALVPYSMASLDDTIIATLVPVLIDEFKRPEDIGWYASAEYLPYAVLMPSLGKAYNLWKIQWLFLGSILIFMVGSITCATAQTSLAFILGRGITGSGGAGILQGAMRINEIAFPRRQRMYAEAAGIGIMGACIMSGPMVGGAIADSLGWQWAFWINLPTSTVSFIGTLFLFPKATPRSPMSMLPAIEKVMQLDPVGSSLLIASICCLITVLQNYSASWDMVMSEADILLAVISALLFVLFLLQEFFIRPDLALIPRAILRRRAVWSNCLLLFVLFMGFTNFLFFLSIFLQVVQGDSPGQSAINLLPYVISATIASGLTAFIVPRARYYNPFFLIGGIMFVIGMGFISKIDQHITRAMNSGLQVVTGVGVGILVLANVAPCHIDLPEKDHAIANGLAFFASSLGSTITVPASSALFNHQIIQGFQGLDIPPLMKLQILKDITSMRKILPLEFLDMALDVVVRAVNLTFIIGLTCSIICVLIILCVPWKPVVSKSSIVPDGGEKRLIS